MSYVLGIVRRVPLSRGRFALVDAEDFRRVMKKKWSLQHSESGHLYAHTTYRKANGRWSKLLLHRFILHAPAGVLVDHKNRDGLDCSRANLRFATYSQNAGNSVSSRGSSRFKGVSWARRDCVWAAHIRVANRPVWLGCFSSEHEAALAYDAAARQHFGEFARTNFPCLSTSDLIG